MGHEAFCVSMAISLRLESSFPIPFLEKSKGCGITTNPLFSLIISMVSITDNFDCISSLIPKPITCPLFVDISTPGIISNPLLSTTL